MGQTFTHNETRVSMSVQSAAHYGAFAAEFPVWAETQGVNEVLIITPEDLFKDKEPSDFTPQEAEVLLKQFIEENFPDFPSENLPNLLGFHIFALLAKVIV